jgi:ELWxxDGT repeat protein
VPMKKRGLNQFFNLALFGLWVTVVLAACPAQAVYLPSLVKDINPGTADSFPSQLTVVGNTLFFVANDGISGSELWKTDNEGTSLVKDITPGPPSSHMYGLKNVGGTLFFVLEKEEAFEGTKYEVWKSDGTETGTVKVAGPFDFIGRLGNDLSTYPLLQAVNGQAYFFAGDHGGEYGLWRSGVTAESTVRITDNSLWVYQLGIGENNVLYFSGEQFSSGSLDRPHLWRTDGTAAGTYPVGGANFFLWLLPAMNSSGVAGWMTVMGDSLFLSAIPRWLGTDGFELWKVDGVGGSETVPELPVADIKPGPYDGSTPEQLPPLGNTLFFTADDGVTGRELWAYGPNPSDVVGYGSWQVKDIHPGAEGSSPKELTVFNEELFFAANVFSLGDLYKTDGTAVGTIKLADLINPERLTVSNGKLFFAGTDAAHGRELWVSDGTVEGTMLALDINPGADGSSLSEMVYFNQALYLVAANDTYGRELFKLVEMDRPDIGEWIERELLRIPPEYFKKGDRGLRTALVSIMREINFLMSQGNLPEAIQKLHNVRRHVDGIGHNNWVTHSDTQVMLSGAIDGYIDALNRIR